uniref:NADH-ubiquinone oxidoreductase chain 2 n=1 Tax=Callopanchax monroviae TaxID=748222 RepID=A0A518QNS6_9TELE|nr:NADH dehydrogenase subunit 2 [Callopanchax monroviae]
MNPQMRAALLLTMVLSTLVTLFSSHWLLAWMGLELNSLAIIPLMAQPNRPRAVEAAMKYFLIQAAAASTLLLAALMNAWFSGQWSINAPAHPTPAAMITLALAMKLGLAPTHAWLPDIIQGLNLNLAMILVTWQKLAPFALLSQLQHSSPLLLTFLGFMSVLAGGWGGLNQTQLRKVLAYSSIAHLGWMLLMLQFSPYLTFLILLIYFAMTFSIFSIFLMNNAYSLNTLMSSWAKNPILAALAPVILLSLGGLPPLLGFIPKLTVIQELTYQGSVLLATLAALSTLLSFYFYMRLSYAAVLTLSPSNITGTLSWRLPSSPLSLPLSISTTMIVLMLPITPALAGLTHP